MVTANTVSVSPRQWQIGLLALALTLIGGVALAVALLLGAANPPYDANLVLNLRSADDLAPAGNLGDLRLFSLPATLTLKPPFTLEMEASLSGRQGVAWGLWLRVSDHDGNPIDNAMLIDNQGYVLSALPAPTLQHQQFPHIQPGDNRLYLHYDASGAATLRINDEIFNALSFPVSTVDAVGLALSGDAKLTWKAIKIYTG